MDFDISPEDAKFREEVVAFLAAHRDKAPAESDTRLKTPQRQAWQQLLLSHGYFARTVPVEYGGRGERPDALKQRILAEEFGRVGITDRMIVANRQGVSMLVPTLLVFGTEEQKRRWIPPTLRGELIWCQGYSEPGAGSDLASVSTRAHVEDGHFVINGQKVWTSEAQQADMIFCLVRTEPDQPKHKGLSFLLVPMNTPGIAVRPLKTMTGRSSFNEVFFTDVRVPEDQIVGRRGEGWAVANETLKHERGALGNPEVAMTRLLAIVELMRRETVDGTPVIRNVVLRDRLLKLQGRLLAMRLNAARLLTLQCKGQDPGLAQLIVKLQGCDLSHQLAGLAVDALGELGTLYEGSSHLRDEGAWQRNYMFDLGLIIGGGTAQIQKNIIAERGLGMPTEPRASAV